MSTLTNTLPVELPLWKNTAMNFSAVNLPNDVSALSKHLDLCKVENKRLFKIYCAVELINNFVVGRFVTTLVVTFVLIGSYYLVV